MERPFVSENAKTREQIVSLAKKLSKEDINLDVAGQWNISVMFTHLAFWDQRALALLKHWKKSGFSLISPVVSDANDTSFHFFKTIPPRTAADLAISAAEAVDHEIETLSDKFIEEIESFGDIKRLGRFEYRRVHIAQIEKILMQGNNNF
jgi:hypothetical protein